MTSAKKTVEKVNKVSDKDFEDSKNLLTNPVKHFKAKSQSSTFEIIESFKSTAFQSRSLANCLDIMISILKDNDRPVVFLGLAGAMVPGGLRTTISDMIDLNIIDVLVSTGANLYHDLHEALGYQHYLAQNNTSDIHLRKHRIDRIFDVYVSDKEFEKTDLYIKDFADSLPPKNYSTSNFLYRLGKTLTDEESILYTAAKKEVPIFCPALADSSIGISLAWYTQDKLKKGQIPLRIDTIQDNLEITKIKVESRKTAAIHIGGGTPKNFIQQVIPMAEILGLKTTPHSYGIQITTDDPKWGGLSGCTFSESQSWGKYSDKARFATVYMDATIGLPLLFKACLEKKETWFPRESINIKYAI